MPIPLSSMISQIAPTRTVLLFGAGASVTSGAPSVGVLCSMLESELGVESGQYTFDELCSLVELRRDRSTLVKLIREKFKNLRPAGGLLNVADFDWVSIFSTNYDDLVEKVYLRKNKPIHVFSSNFDFGLEQKPQATPIFKIHGTIHQDVVDGHRSRLILTSEDNDLCEDYREALYDRLRSDINSNDLVIVGHSLSDADLDAVIKRAIKIKQKSVGSRHIYLLVYSKDENRALLHEAKGVRVSFGGIEDFFFELARQAPEHVEVFQTSGDVIPSGSILNTLTYDIEHESAARAPDFGRMFSGAPPSYADIRAGQTFSRTAEIQIIERLTNEKQFEMIVGAGGVGKTALARKVALSLVEKGFYGWEHQSDRPFLVDEWLGVAAKLSDRQENGVLVLDDAHLYLPQVNQLADQLISQGRRTLRLVITSGRNHWRPRVKSPELFRWGTVTELSQLDHGEIVGLLSFVEASPQVSRLVDNSFRGFTPQEKRRRLVERCNRDFFVCLKNIFANDNFDTIVLREYASIEEAYQEIYKYVCALETFGVRVHRQLIIRLLQIAAQDVGFVLGNLEGLVEEYEISRRESIYGWRGRHVVISEIIAKHKFNRQEEIFELLKRVVRGISPTYDVEIRTLRQLCSFDGGLPRISGTAEQNELLRMMISVAPRERVPRHRLINNLIRSGAFTDAETEIRVFENDLNLDGPVRRYKVRLAVERAISTTGLLPEDKAAMLNEAYTAALRIIERDPLSRQSLQLFGDVCLELFKVTGEFSFVDDASDRMKNAERELGDPEITRLIYRFEQRVSPGSHGEPEFDVADEPADVGDE